jgi:hypothetical protein
VYSMRALPRRRTTSSALYARRTLRHRAFSSQSSHIAAAQAPAGRLSKLVFMSVLLVKLNGQTDDKAGMV